MTSNWKEYKLKNILAEKGYIRGPFGSALKRRELKNTGIPVYEQQHAIYNNRNFRFFIDEKKYEELHRFSTETNDLIISCSGTVGKVTIVKESDPKGIISQALLILRANTEIALPVYLKYFFESTEGYNSIISRSSGSVQINIAKREVIENIPIKLPDLKTQRKIAKVLSAIDDKIELNNSINNNLGQQAQSIFKSWFVDFEPFGGTMPDGWITGHLSDLADVKSGKRPNKKSTDKTIEMNIPIVGAASIMGYTNEYLYNEKILVTGRVGTHGVIQKFCTPCWTSDNTLIIVTKYYEFVYQVLKTIDFQNMNRGSTQPLITQTDLKNIEIIIPGNDILENFEVKIDSLMKLQNNLLAENEQLSALRDTLLPKLMSGEIDIEEVEV